MATTNISTRNEKLVQNIKDIGQSLINNAEKIANDFKYHTDLTITCYPAERETYPRIVVETEFVPEKIVERYIKEAIKRLAGSVPSQTKANVDAKHQFEKETNELMNVLAKLDIAATDENGEFRLTSDILKDIAEKWNT